MKIASLILAMSVSAAIGGETMKIDGKSVEIVKTGKYSPENATDKLAAQSFADTLLPVRRTFEDGRLFWNGFARQFIYAPEFEFKKLEALLNTALRSREATRWNSCSRQIRHMRR